MLILDAVRMIGVIVGQIDCYCCCVLCTIICFGLLWPVVAHVADVTVDRIRHVTVDLIRRCFFIILRTI